jgi:NAD(P)-dependent dehydrogenase (short-subunit alcohol dehydrogenase family)
MGSAGQQALAVKADVSSSGEVDAMFARVGEHYGQLDILVNNAGIGEADSARGTELRPPRVRECYWPSDIQAEKL